MKLEIDGNKYDVCTIEYNKDVKEFLENFAHVWPTKTNRYYIINNLTFQFKIDQ